MSKIYYYGESAPDNTKLLWIDQDRVLHYYNKDGKYWSYLPGIWITGSTKTGTFKAITRKGYVVSKSAPSDTDLLWFDCTQTVSNNECPVIKFYNSNSWVACVGVWQGNGQPS